MKIIRIYKGSGHNWTLKYDLKMKLTTLLFVVSLFTIKASTYSQNTKISLALENVSIEEVFGEIESLTDFRFFYNHRKIDVTKKVTINAVDARISNILNELFLHTNIYFKVRKKQIIVKTGRTPVPKTSASKTTDELQNQIRGTVTDDSGSLLPGVNVVVQGTSIGTQTDFDGNYVISASKGDVLVFSYIGFSTQNITVGDDDTVDVSMQEDTAQLDEVVVVGYGTTTKRKLTSSITSVKVEDVLNEVPSTNLSNTLAGRFSGVTFLQSTGKPGVSTDITIRGATQGEFSGSIAPLYVIDNIVSTKEQFDALDASEVDDVSILKDAAAAAVYGSRGANGVVLVTTRRGKTGKPTVNVTSSYGSTNIAKDVENLSPYETALLVNENTRFNALPGEPAPENLINQQELDYLQNLPDYGSFAEQLTKTSVLVRNAVTISGGTDKVNYFMSGSHVSESGYLENFDYEKTNFRAKVDVDITDNLNVSLNLNHNNDLREEFYWRWNGGNESFTDFYRTATRTGRLAPVYIDGLPVANFNGWNAGNIVSEGQGFNDRTRRNQGIIASLTYKIPFVDGLSANITYNRNSLREGQHLARFALTDYTFGTEPGNRYALTNEVIGTRVRADDGANTNSVQRSTGDTNTYQLNMRLNYGNSFGDHDVNASVIYEEWERDGYNVLALRRRLFSRELPELFASDGDVENQISNGGVFEEGRQSFVGVLGYSYKNKYLVNGSFRADASVRFREENRWGYFPAVSVGWVASEENFVQNNLSFLDYFKIRYSIGETGNDDVFGDGSLTYPYLLSYRGGLSGAVFGGSSAVGTFLSGEPDIDVTWATQLSTNLGFDLRFLDSKLFTSVEFYKNRRRDLYGTRQEFVPASSGIALQPTNYGAVDVSGIDIEAGYADSIGDLKYDIGLRFGSNKSEYANIDEPESRRPHLIRTGRSTESFGRNSLRGYRALGIIRTQEQLDGLIADGYSFNGQTPMLGELYFADIRGNSVDDPQGNTPDGIIDDNDVETLHDRFTAPINYGITLNLAYKGFSLQAFAQGLEGHKKFVPFIGRFTPGPDGGPWTSWGDSWTFDNPNAAYPRYGSRNLGASSFFLRDAGFLRLKYINFSYDFPQNIADAIGAKNIQLFSNATNLFFIYRKIDEFDPEIQGEGVPISKSYSLGLNLTF